MKNENQVPEISVSGDCASSNATIPAITADTCACWKPEEMKKAKSLLRKKTEVICCDATAYCALTSLALNMLMQGKVVKAKITQDWQKVSQ